MTVFDAHLNVVDEIFFWAGLIKLNLVHPFFNLWPKYEDLTWKSSHEYVFYFFLKLIKMTFDIKNTKFTLIKLRK